MKKTIHILTFVIGFAMLISVSGTVEASTNKRVLLNCEDYKDNEIISLACNIYFEARGQGKAGMLLVALATRNRVEARIYPNSYAEVTWEIRKKRVPIETPENEKQRYKIVKVPMYSWTLDGQPDFIYNLREWIKALHIAAEFHAERIGRDQERTPDITFGCMWYHNETVNPFWASSYHKTVKVKGHQCYAVNEDAYHQAMLEVVR